MAFEKGQSGNSAGKPPGAKSWHTLIRDELREDAPALIEKLKDAAFGGDADALKFLIQAILPREKATAPPVCIPALETAGTLTEKAAAVLNAIASGVMPPDIGGALISAISQTAKVIEIDELAKRIAKIEEATNND